MKNLFPEFDSSKDYNFKGAWDDGIFVFDTNCLLNLYRYRTETRNQLLNVLEKISDRIWIPHHVALEFQRNRLTVISDQNRKFSAAESATTKAVEVLKSEFAKLQLEQRHSSIDPSPMIDQIESVANSFIQTLREGKQSQQRINQVDELKNRLESLFDEKVGPKPESQIKLTEIYTEGKRRYDSLIPPGYCDKSKEKDNIPIDYSHDGLIYKRQYGDLLIWFQILDHALAKNVKTVVFITSDAKEDWWWKENDQGEKTLGPRPELVSEAKFRGKIENFYMFTPERFLELSNDHIEAKISSEAIQEVGEVNKALLNEAQERNGDLLFSQLAEVGVYEWLRSQYARVRKRFRSFPDFTVAEDRKLYGFEVMASSVSPAMTIRRLRRKLRAHSQEMLLREFEDLTFVVAVPTEFSASDLTAHLGLSELSGNARDFQIVVGYIAQDNNGPVFHPFAEARGDRVLIY